MTRAVDIIRKVAPSAKKNYVSAFEQGDELLRKHSIDTPDRLAHFLAQVLHETGGLIWERESLNYGAERLCQVFGRRRHSACITPQEAQSLARNEPAIGERVYGLGNPNKARELGNIHHGDGFRYRGGGLLQTTGRANYRRMSELCGVDFEAAPELIVSPDHALRPALCVWSAGKLNAYADCNDILAISRAINLGSPRSRATPNGLQDRVRWLAEILPLIDEVEFHVVSGSRPSEPESVQERHASSSVGIAARLGRRLLRAGDEDETVRAVQLALRELAYPLQGTGYFGPKTEAAVRDFQVKHNLEIDGVVGPETAGAIDAATGRSQPVPEVSGVETPASGEPSAWETTRDEAAAPRLTEILGDRMLQIGDWSNAVRVAQLALAKLGYQLKGTGYFGGATDIAVTHFQETRRLEIDGIIGPETAKAIDAEVAARVQHDLAENVAKGQPEILSRDDRPLWLIEALRWLDVREGQGRANNPHILEWARDEGGAIATSYRQDSIPWCALYANMVLTKTGCRGTETLWALDFVNWGQKLEGPAVGAFVPMVRRGGGHIAIVVGRDQHGNLMCIGGNQADAVNIKPFPKARPVGYRWPTGTPLPMRVGFETLPLVKSNGIVSAREG